MVLQEAGKAKRTVLLLTLLFGLVSVFAPTVQAVEYGNIGGKPAFPDSSNPRTSSIFIKYAGPNETVRDGVQVVNFTNETKTLLVYATDSIVSSGGVFGCAQMVDEKKAVGSWVAMDKTEVTLPSGGTEVIGFSVTPPVGADVGENDGCIVIQEKNAAPQTVEGENTSINLSFRTAIRLAVFLPGDVKKSVIILGYAAARTEDGNFVLKPRVKNNGNVSLDATLNTYTKGILGGGEDNYTQESPLLRNVTSDWNIPYKRPFWGGWIKSKFTVTYDANVDNSLGESTSQNLVTLESNQIIFFSPPKPLALLIYLLLLAILAVIAYRIYRGFMGAGKKRKTKEWRTLTITNPVDIETLAKSYNASWKEIAKANRIKPPYILKTGDVVKVPIKSSTPIIGGSKLPGMDMLMMRLNRKKIVQDWKPVTIQNQIDIESLANKYAVSWKLLAQVNRIKPPYILKPGDVIRVPLRSVDGRPGSSQQRWPGTGPLAYFARKRLAENWETITVGSHVDGVVNNQMDIEAVARTYGVPWKLLAKINKIKPPYILKQGDRIKVPPRRNRI